MKKLDKSQIFLCFLLSLVIGIFGGSFWFFSQFFIKINLVFGLIFLIVFWNNKKVRITIFCFLIFFWGWQSITKSLSEIPKEIENKNFSGEVTIIKQPQKKKDYQRIVGKNENLGKLIFYVDIFSEIDYGDILKLECRLEFPENKDDKFDYQKYLAKDKIFYICKKTKWEKVGEGGNIFLAKIFNLKDGIEKIIDRRIVFPESELLSGLLLGKSGSFPEALEEDFSRTGLTHIVAVSGYNITIIANYLMLLGILLGLWRQKAFYLAVLGIILFIILIGFPSSALRAGVMGILILLAMKNGRLSNSQNALLLAGAIMLFKNPMILRFDIGFQLSFLATLGIIYFYPLIQDFFAKKEKTINFLQETVFLTFSAQVFVLPIILFNFGNLSLISLLANLLILPIVPLAMLLGFLMIVFSWIAFLPLAYETRLAAILSRVPLASVEVSFPVWGVVLWYVFLVFLINFYKKKVVIT